MSPEWCKVKLARVNIPNVEIGLFKNLISNGHRLGKRQIHRPLIHISLVVTDI